MKVGDRVEFVGPAYPDGVGPKVGSRGLVVETGSGWVTLHGRQPCPLVTVLFDGRDRPTVLGQHRLTVLGVTPQRSLELSDSYGM